MRAIVKLNTTVTGNKITITGEIIDVNFPAFLGQRTTILHAVNGNPSVPRHIQINSHGVIVIRHGADGVLFPKDEMVSLMLEVDSKLTDAPVFVNHPHKDNLVGDVKSEIPATATIQVSEDGKEWKDCVGQNVKPEHGKHYRCVAANKNGTTTSKSFHVPHPKK